MTTALIIGGGVAGPVAAMALQRAGIDATIYEGSGLDGLTPHGLRHTAASLYIAAGTLANRQRALTRPRVDLGAGGECGRRSLRRR